jgi:hypothetical protein
MKILILVFASTMTLLCFGQSDEPYNQLFPIYGVIPGKTSLHDLEMRGFQCEISRDNSKMSSCDYRGVSFSDYEIDNLITHMTFDIANLPYKWEQNFGFSGEASYDEWIETLTRLGFSIAVKEEPSAVTDEDRSYFTALINATSPSEKTVLELLFGYGNDHNEGFSPSSKRSLYSLAVSVSGIDDAIYPVVNNLEAAPEHFFPIYGFAIGETAYEEFLERGIPCDTTDRSISCDVKGLTFWDHDGDQIAEDIYYIASDVIPYTWERYFGFVTEQSYDAWIKQLTQLGFVIEVKEEPSVSDFRGMNVFTAEVVATLESEQFEVELDFNYGNRNNEGYQKDSLRSLYSLTFRSTKEPEPDEEEEDY